MNEESKDYTLDFYEIETLRDMSDAYYDAILSRLATESDIETIADLLVEYENFFEVCKKLDLRR